MPPTYTATDQINYALRLLGVLAEGELPSAETSADALMALNQMLDSWSTERLSVFTTETQIFTWPAGSATKTLGPSGDFVGERPILLDPATYYVYNQTSYDVTIINQAQYNSIGLKTIAASMPQYIFVDTAVPDVSISLWPVPTTDLEFHFVGVKPLAQVDDPTIVLVFPPGYLEAFAYNLAVRLAPQFGVEASQTVKRIASSTKRNVRRINNTEDVMSVPSALLPMPGRFNWYTGQPY